MNLEKLEGISGLLTGILFIIVSLGMLYALATISAGLESLAALDPALAGGLSAINTAIIAGYALSMLALITGISWLVTGIMHLVAKKS
ncbi:MAG: hypothetical protein HY367_01480 [Candidatus Aenigmarchaeota archaeon]|nr:hypothetical protein [Candidatus Aenigmarchaeota archaeon]